MKENERQWKSVLRDFPWVWHFFVGFNHRHVPPEILNGEELTTPHILDRPLRRDQKLWIYKWGVDTESLAEVEIWEGSKWEHFLSELYRNCDDENSIKAVAVSCSNGYLSIFRTPKEMSFKELLKRYITSSI